VRRHRGKLPALSIGVSGIVVLHRRERCAHGPSSRGVPRAAPNSIVRTCQAVNGIVDRRRKEVVPLLVSLLKEKPPEPTPGNEVRIGAANYLGRLGPDASHAVPALREALTDDEERFREVVAWALARIQRQE